MLHYTNARHAFVATLGEVLTHGTDVTVKGQRTKEILMRPFTVARPQERVILAKGRNGNIFAQIAEKLWMLDGRNDLDWLERYIPH